MNPPTVTTAPVSTEARASLLAHADADSVVELAEQVIETTGLPTVLAGPEVGMVMLQVREPVVGERFHLGEVVVTTAEVELAGARGWSMRLGRDRVATLAAAVVDAAAQLDGFAVEVDELCRRTGDALARADEASWAQLAPTAVRFEELD